MPLSSSTTITKELHQIRPRIEQSYPIAGYSVLAFSIFNLVLGTVLFFYQVHFGDIAILNWIFNYQFWGVVFFGLGLLMLASYIRNDREAILKLLPIGIGIKVTWAVALLFRAIGNLDDRVLQMITVFWIAILAWQFIVYVFFSPPDPEADGQ